MKKLAAVQKPTLPPEVLVRVDEAQLLAGRGRSDVLVLRDAYATILGLLADVKSGKLADQAVLDKATRQWVRAVEDVVASANRFSAKAVYQGPRSVSNRWANLKAAVAGWIERQVHDFAFWRRRRQAVKRLP